ncbi:uncharacterized protein EV422DRAFT_564274 [Fimicolochytrium jonesii]|uniref:uncharacterized protein n=1 Tax=Fimicolochytrium jonesii TaxID=1396493 RepID=UPI0022FEA425|nr:uncharacterized protein EV422DRAFT_564274 [Fimicolochytrium jonesii]KAI8824915.1 hypothetical protein EV422DRAFT_564274 [Fimicolochytrium jonesii]
MLYETADGHRPPMYMYSNPVSHAAEPYYRNATHPDQSPRSTDRDGHDEDGEGEAIRYPSLDQHRHFPYAGKHAHTPSYEDDLEQPPIIVSSIQEKAPPFQDRGHQPELDHHSEGIPSHFSAGLPPPVPSGASHAPYTQQQQMLHSSYPSSDRGDVQAFESSPNHKDLHHTSSMPELGRQAFDESIREHDNGHLTAQADASGSYSTHSGEYTEEDEAETRERPNVGLSIDTRSHRPDTLLSVGPSPYERAYGHRSDAEFRSPISATFTEELQRSPHHHPYAYASYSATDVSMMGAHEAEERIPYGFNPMHRRRSVSAPPMGLLSNYHYREGDYGMDARTVSGVGEMGIPAIQVTNGSPRSSSRLGHFARQLHHPYQHSEPPPSPQHGRLRRDEECLALGNKAHFPSTTSSASPQHHLRSRSFPFHPDIAILSDFPSYRQDIPIKIITLSGPQCAGIGARVPTTCGIVRTARPVSLVPAKRQFGQPHGSEFEYHQYEHESVYHGHDGSHMGPVPHSMFQQHHLQQSGSAYSVPSNGYPHQNGMIPYSKHDMQHMENPYPAPPPSSQEETAAAAAAAVATYHMYQRSSHLHLHQNQHQHRDNRYTALTGPPHPPLFVPAPRMHKCPKPFCTKVYKNANGLKYHLDRGMCEHDTSSPTASASIPGGPKSASPTLLHNYTTRPHSPAEPTTPSSASPYADPIQAAAAGTVKIAHRPYWCKVPACGKKYKNLNGLKYHAKAAHPMLDFRDDVKGVFMAGS